MPCCYINPSIVPVKKEFAMRPHGFNMRDPFCVSGLHWVPISDKPMFCSIGWKVACSEVAMN